MFIDTKTKINRYFFMRIWPNLESNIILCNHITCAMEKVEKCHWKINRNKWLPCGSSNGSSDILSYGCLRFWNKHSCLKLELQLLLLLLLTNYCCYYYYYYFLFSVLSLRFINVKTRISPTAPERFINHTW